MDEVGTVWRITFAANCLLECVPRRGMVAFSKEGGRKKV